MLRPAESHGLQIRSGKLEIHPAHQLSWEHDVFDNSIAQVNFSEKTEELRISSRYTVEQFNINPFNFVLEIYTNELPFAYRGDEAADLAPYLERQYPKDTPAIKQWVRPFLDSKGRGKTLQFLLALNEAVPAQFGYSRREEPGIQSPAETLNTRSGSCRDFALLFMEAARCMGLAARYVSGYLCGGETDRRKSRRMPPTPGRKSICPAEAGKGLIQPAAFWPQDCTCGWPPHAIRPRQHRFAAAISARPPSFAA